MRQPARLTVNTALQRGQALAHQHTVLLVQTLDWIPVFAAQSTVTLDEVTLYVGSANSE